MIVLGPAGVASWPQTSTVTSTKAVDHELCINHTMLGQWPTTPFFGDPSTPLEGNQWVFANIGGRWYGGAADWYRPGQACKDVTASNIGSDAFLQLGAAPLLVPGPGRDVRVDVVDARALVSGHAHDRPANERGPDSLEREPQVRSGHGRYSCPGTCTG